MIRTIALTTALVLIGTSCLAQNSYGNSGTGGPDANMNNVGGLNGPENSDGNAHRNNVDATGMSQNRPSSGESFSPVTPAGTTVNKKSDLTKPRGGDGADGR